MLWRMLSWECLLAQQFHLSERYHSEFQEVTSQRRGILGRKALGQAQYPQIPSRTELDITDGDSHLYLPVQRGRCSTVPLNPRSLFSDKNALLALNGGTAQLSKKAGVFPSTSDWIQGHVLSALVPLDVRGNQDLENQKPFCSMGV